MVAHGAGNHRNEYALNETLCKTVVFQYFIDKGADSNSNPLPTNAFRIANRDTMIADHFDSRVFLINPQKQIVFQYGITNLTGGFNELYDPYTGFVIGDYTEQAPPPTSFQ